jgi:tRNA1(Val) A37 N6-methylase TrmN6
MEIPHSIDDFLGGELKLMQPLDGYRISIDTLLLAASIPAQAGDKILEAGTGSAGAALCLAKRVADVHVTGLELQTEMLGFARENITLNGMDDRVFIVQGDIVAPPIALKAGSFDHVIANPPYLSDGTANRSPNQNKDIANMDTSASLKHWVNFCINMARHKGSITFIYRTDRLDELLSKLYGKVGDLVLCPLWPHAGEPAKRILVQGRKGVSGGMSVLPGLVLHSDTQGYTEQTEAILRSGSELNMGTIKPMKSLV